MTLHKVNVELFSSHFVDSDFGSFQTLVTIFFNRSAPNTMYELYRVSPNFACGSEMWSLRRLLFVRQTGSSLPILEMCGFRFRQFLATVGKWFALCCRSVVCPVCDVHVLWPNGCTDQDET